MWNYKATVLRVVDGDTVDLNVDLGFDIYLSMRVRISGIDTLELNSNDPATRAQAILAKARVVDLLPAGSSVEIVTEKGRREKFGRYLAIIKLSDERSVGEIMIQEGFATPYFGGKRDERKN